MLAAALFLAPVLGACSSDSGGADRSTTTSSTDDPTTTAADGTTTTGGADPTTTTAAPSSTTTTSPLDIPPVTAEEQPYVDALVAASTDEANTDLPLDPADAPCVATLWVQAIGVDRFTAADIAPDDLTAGAEEGGSYFDRIDGIGDAATAQELVTSLSNCQVDLVVLVAGLVGGPDGLDEDQTTCFVGKLDRLAVESSLASALDGDSSTEPALDDTIGDAVDACLN